jgi:hypothetical protein
MPDVAAQRDTVHPVPQQRQHITGHAGVLVVEAMRAKVEGMRSATEGSSESAEMCRCFKNRARQSAQSGVVANSQPGDPATQDGHVR